MRLWLIETERDLQEYRQRFRLFFDGCFPWNPTAHEDRRYGLLTDDGETVLAVCSVPFPVRPPSPEEDEEVLSVLSLVLTHPDGLPRLIVFLRRFMTVVRPRRCVVRFRPLPPGDAPPPPRGTSGGEDDDHAAAPLRLFLPSWGTVVRGEVEDVLHRYGCLRRSLRGGPQDPPPAAKRRHYEDPPSSPAPR